MTSFSLLTDLVKWACCFLIGVSPAYGYDIEVPHKSFFLRYQDASLIVYGEVESVTPLKEPHPALKGVRANSIFRVQLKPETVFKQGELKRLPKKIEFVFFKPSGVRANDPMLKEAIEGIRERVLYLVYLEKIQDTYVAKKTAGIRSFNRKFNRYIDHPEPKALAALEGGKSMPEAIKLLGKREQDAFAAGKPEVIGD